jgi:uncharacterized FlaG/YvyC family protein
MNDPISNMTSGVTPSSYGAQNPAAQESLAQAEPAVGDQKASAVKIQEKTVEKAQESEHSKSPSMSSADIEAAVGRINEVLRDVKFSVLEDGDQLQVTVEDGTGQLIRKFPSDELLETLRKIQESTGAMFDQSL